MGSWRMQKMRSQQSRRDPNSMKNILIRRGELDIRWRKENTMETQRQRLERYTHSQGLSGGPGTGRDKEGSAPRASAGSATLLLLTLDFWLYNWKRVRFWLF